MKFRDRPIMLLARGTAILIGVVPTLALFGVTRALDFIHWRLFYLSTRFSSGADRIDARVKLRMARANDRMDEIRAAARRL